jgi:hypothetical protein
LGKYHLFLWFFMFTLLISLVAFSSFTSLKHKSWIAGLFSFIFIMLEWFSFFYVFIWANIFATWMKKLYFCLVVNYFVIFFQNNVFIVDISYIWQRCPHGWPKATKFWAFSTSFKEIIFNWNLFKFCNTIFLFFCIYFQFLSDITVRNILCKILFCTLLYGVHYFWKGVAVVLLAFFSLVHVCGWYSLKLFKRYCTMLHLFDDLWLDKIIPKNNDRKESHIWKSRENIFLGSTLFFIWTKMKLCTSLIQQLKFENIHTFIW